MYFISNGVRYIQHYVAYDNMLLSAVCVFFFFLVTYLVYFGYRDFFLLLSILFYDFKKYFFQNIYIITYKIFMIFNNLFLKKKKKTFIYSSMQLRTRACV